MKKKCFLLLLLFLGIQTTCLFSQCQILEISEDPYTTHFYESNNIKTTLIKRSYSNIERVDSILIDYEVKDQKIVKEQYTITLDLLDFIQTFFEFRHPALSCEERLVLNTQGDTLLLEKMKLGKFGFKTWSTFDYQTKKQFLEHTMSKSFNTTLHYIYKYQRGKKVLNTVFILEEDKKGNLVRIQEVNTNGHGLMEDKYDYDFDDCGNWTIRYRIENDGGKAIDLKRRIVY